MRGKPNFLAGNPKGVQFNFTINTFHQIQFHVHLVAQYIPPEVNIL